MRREGPPRGRFICAAARRSGADVARARRAGAAVPQPPRLCAAHAVPRLRFPPAMPELRRLAGRSSLPQAAGLPPLRLLHAAAGGMSELPRHRKLRRRRPRRRAAGAGGGRAVSQGAHPWCCRAISWNWSSGLRAGARRRRRRAASISSSARSWSPRAIIFPSSIWSASSTPISALATAIRVPPSARFSCCIRWSGRAGREEGRGVGYLQTHQPEHPVMRALISGDREAFYKNEIEQRERTGYPPFGRLASLVITANERHAAEAYGRTLASARAARRTRPRARARRSADRGGARPPSLPAAGEIAARFRSVGLSAAWLAAAPKPRGNVRLEVDVDPQSFF